MKRFIFLVFLALPALILKSSNNTQQFDSLLNVLDKSIKERESYTNNKLYVIRELDNQVNQTNSVEKKFILYGQLFEEYKSLQMDSAFMIAGKRATLAEKIGNETFRNIASLNRAEVMIVTGMYKEALDILNNQNEKKHNNEVVEYAYHLYHSLYMLMAEYSFSGTDKEYYQQLEYNYKDSILSVIDEKSVTYGLVKSSKLVYDEKYDEALDIAMRTYHDNIEDARISAMITHTIADIYTAQRDTYNMKKYLTLSSIYDMHSGVKEYMSLPELAVLLYNADDIDRAYVYIKCSMEDAIFCKARLRALQMSRMLPIINSTYDIKMKQEKDRLVVFLIIIIFLSIILAVALFFLYKKLKELAMARYMLKKTNEHLNEINTDLKKLNEDLYESNHVKEEYISYVFTMCSAYIDKLEDFRKRVSRKIKTGQIEDLYKEIKTNTFVTDELKDFYKSFDSIFMNIYPNFVKDFNALLQDDGHIYPKDGELLSPELRIYALVRLGISDSVKIASFLHYSPQTVYNYRLKVRNKAKISKDEFPQAVKQLGQFSM